MESQRIGRRLAAALAALVMTAGLAVVGASPAMAYTVDTTVKAEGCEDVRLSLNNTDTGLVALIQTNAKLEVNCLGMVATGLKKNGSAVELTETFEAYGGGPELELEATFPF